MNAPVKRTKSTALGKKKCLALLNTEKNLFHRKGPERGYRLPKKERTYNYYISETENKILTLKIQMFEKGQWHTPGLLFSDFILQINLYTVYRCLF